VKKPAGDTTSVTPPAGSLFKHKTLKRKALDRKSFKHNALER
jgi:hypothetical protein